MTTLVWMAIGAVFIGGSVGCTGADRDESSRATDVETGREAELADVPQACDVFTLEMARQILGDSAKQSELSAPFTGSTDDLAGSTCTYEAEDPTPVNRFVTTITASMMLRGAKTDTGRSSNRFTFEQARTQMEQGGEAPETVTGVGDAAYYIGGVINQLTVLVDGGQYELNVSASDPDGDNRGATEQLAKMVMAKL
jgi:hypothetical protein